MLFINAIQGILSWIVNGPNPPRLQRKQNIDDQFSLILLKRKLHSFSGVLILYSICASFLPSFSLSCLPLFLSSFHPFLPSVLPSFHPSFFPSFLSSFLSSFLFSFLPSFLPSFFISFLPFFLPSFRYASLPPFNLSFLPSLHPSSHPVSFAPSCPPLFVCLLHRLIDGLIEGLILSLLPLFLPSFLPFCQPFIHHTYLHGWMFITKKFQSLIPLSNHKTLPDSSHIPFRACTILTVKQNQYTILLLHSHCSDIPKYLLDLDVVDAFCVWRMA